MTELPRRICCPLPKMKTVRRQSKEKVILKSLVGFQALGGQDPGVVEKIYL